ncbi:MAG: hypothetical protein UT40_C0014G0020 [Candidatus Woesebacteria bacterium GW2011_GWA1_39_21b]|uniref:Uncharacterized protein n=1 Tax=Candidatus Woesebacteria bacterium GW2011_GWA1_39_21b TaxID=1618551 RepID=A0A0G0NBM5_9BACT|nr:MAG: hypothetical protein UT40_C0014G0020 [Candidatus Woesebacteria bacterium GW2011_GWA1_39_21b]
MTKLQKKIATAIATGALLFQTVIPVLAQSTTLVISGNGAETDNDINLSQTTTTTVVQNNVANISNNVDADAETGENDQNYNTGGPVSLTTGDATTGVAISNTANSNVAEVSGCCDVDVDVEISDNGYKSTGGPVSMETGDADTTVLIANKANSNWAKIGDGSGGASVSLKIIGNGAETDNDINLLFDRSLLLTQDNYANIKNKVDADAETGENDQNYNTGGPVSLETGDATTVVGIDNLANFNFADLNCGCLLDVVAKIAGNGYNADSDISAALLDTKAAFQTNSYVCGYGYQFPWGGGGDLSFPWYGYQKKACNDVDAEAETGENDQNKNTGHSADPSMETGDATTWVDIENTANSNVLIEGGLGLPELPDFDFEFDLGFNWLLWWGLLSGNSS